MNPLIGLVYHWIGGFAAGSFYAPYKKVRNWSWEIYWLVGGFFSWILAPWIFSAYMTEDLIGVLSQQSTATLAWTYFFGVMWGVGGLTFGLTMRYLGMSLGMGVALGFTAGVGTLLPPVIKSIMPGIPDVYIPENIVQIASSNSGLITLSGIAVCLLGIYIAAMAGLTKEKGMSETEKKQAISEFNFSKGMVVAVFAGVMSACFAFGFTAGKPINEATIAAGTDSLWSGLPTLPVILLGGFTTNFICCFALSIRNKSIYEYYSSEKRTSAEVSDETAIPLARNYVFSAMAGLIWYM